MNALWDHMAMSGYSTITHLCESPVLDGLLVAGTDDGLVQLSSDAGATWQPAADLPDFPADGFINTVRASEHDADTVFVAGDAHKNGDYSPYVFVSHDRGASWESLSNDLPDTTIVWAIQQDHHHASLLFLGTEFGLYASVNAGRNWHRLGKDMPTISFRDIALQRRDNDLVAASFGRGIYVLDDYSALRQLADADADTDAELDSDSTLFPVRDAWWYVPHQTAQAAGQPTLGSTAYAAPNPDFGAAITYHLSQDLLSAKAARIKQDKADRDDGSHTDFPGWDALHSEHLEREPALHLVVRDRDGETVRKLAAETKAGLHRTAWDLRRPAPGHVELNEPAFREPWETPAKGPLVAPGTYSVELMRTSSTGYESMSERQEFQVIATPAVAQSERIGETVAFWTQVSELQHQLLLTTKDLERAEERLKQRRADLNVDTAATDVDIEALHELHVALSDARSKLKGDPVREKLSEARHSSITELVTRVSSHQWETTQAPTQTQREAIAAALVAFDALEIPVV